MAGELKFPSRAERKKLVEELRNKINTDPDAAASKYFKEYADAIEELESKMDKYSALDENGIPKDLSAEDAEDLKQSIVNAAQKGETYISLQISQGKSPAEGLTGTVNTLQGLMSKDYNALNAYDPAHPTSLPELQENARSQTIDLRDRKLGTLSNRQNERIPMTVVNSKGEKRRGVYTKGKYMSVKKDFDKLINAAKEKCKTPEQQAELDKFYANYRNYLIGKRARNGGTIGKRSDDALIIGHFAWRMSFKYPNKLTDENVRSILALGKVDDKKIPKGAIEVLKDGFGKMKDDISYDINGARLEIKEGERIDNRNTALSAVADLFGCSDAVAKSENMRFIGEDGKVTEGTFMEYAEGYDVANNPWMFNHIKINPYGDEANRNKLFKQIADLQVIDYLCLNEDRHQGNLIYDIDQEGNLTGIKAIDNDSTFSLAEEGAIKRSDLRVISRSMHDYVMNTTKEMYKFSLRGRGLSEEQMDSAVLRFELLKADVLSGRVETVEDNEFGKKNIDQFKPKDKERDNLFSMVDRLFTVTAYKARDPEVKFTPMPKNKTELSEVAATSRRGTVGGLSDSLEAVSRKLDNKETGFKVGDLTKKYRGSSQEFKDMVRAEKEAEDLLKELKENKKVDVSKLAEEDPETYDKVTDAFSKISQKNDEYLAKKMKERGVTTLEELRGKNDYEQKRINYALDVKKTVREFNKMMSGPATKEEVEELQTNQQRRQLEDSRKAAENKQGGPVL